MACRCVEIREMSCRQAADSFDIPYSMLRDRVSGRVVQGATSGPRTYLSDSEEGEVVNFLIHCADVGCAKLRKQVIAPVQSILDSKGMCVHVMSGWWVSFRKQHPELTLRLAEPLATVRLACVSKEVVAKNF